MLIKINSNDIWLPIHFYDETFNFQLVLSIVEIFSYLICAYILTLNIYIILKIKMFHRNLYILAIPLFGIWFELIIGKLITIAYRLKILNPGFELGVHIKIWTSDPTRMLKVESVNGLELLIFGGFLQWHYMFTVIFGVLAIAVERVVASVLIELVHIVKGKFI